MLHILREYAQGQLARSTEAEVIAHRHASYYLARAEAAAPELHLAHQEQWLLQLEEEHDNLRLALEWFLTHDHVDEALRLVAALGWFWVKQDHHSEGFGWVMRALDQGRASPEVRAKAILFGGGRLAYFVAQMRNNMHELLAEALAWAKTAPDRYCEAWALGYLGLYHEIAEGEHEQAIARCLEALHLFQKERPIDHGTAWVLNALGVIYALRGLFAESITYLEKSLATSRQMENGWGIRLILMNLGLVAYQQGNYDHARQCFLELFPLWGHVQHHHDLANWLCGLGLVYAGSRQTHKAMVIFSGVDKLLTANALRLSYPINHFYEHTLGDLRQKNDPRLLDAWQEGQRLGTESLIEYARSGVAS
jgi:tetratricopeptide (TPR) repeat protein